MVEEVCIMTDPSPVVPSVGAVPVEVPEEPLKSAIRDDLAKAGLDCLEPGDRAVVMLWLNKAYRLIAARVRAEERRRIALELFTTSEGEWLRSAGRVAPTAGNAPPPTFDALLSDPAEQFDTRGELLPALVRYLGLPTTADMEPLLRSIEEYRNAPPAAFTVPPVATPVEPVDEVVCPNCEHTIRARMSDQPDTEQDGQR